MLNGMGMSWFRGNRRFNIMPFCFMSADVQSDIRIRHYDYMER